MAYFEYGGKLQDVIKIDLAITWFMIAKLFSLCRDIFGFHSYISYSNLHFYVIVFNLFCYFFLEKK